MIDWDTISYYLGLLLRDTRRMLPIYTIGSAFAVSILLTRWITKIWVNHSWRSDNSQLHEIAKEKIEERDKIIKDQAERIENLEKELGILRSNTKGALMAINQGLAKVQQGSLELVSSGFTKLNQGVAILGGVDPVGTREESGTTREGKEAKQNRSDPKAPTAAAAKQNGKTKSA